MIGLEYIFKKQLLKLIDRFFGIHTKNLHFKNSEFKNGINVFIYSDSEYQCVHLYKTKEYIKGCYFSGIACIVSRTTTNQNLIFELTCFFNCYNTASFFQFPSHSSNE